MVLALFLLGMAGLFANLSSPVPAGDVLRFVSTCVAAFLLIRVFLGISYFMYFTGTTGQTPGKAILGMRVVRVDGSPQTMGLGFLRWVAYLVSGSIFCLGYLWIVIDPRKRAWHDFLAGTVVICPASHPFDAESASAEKGLDNAGEVL